MKRNKRIKKGDTVIAIAGNDKGNSGKVLNISGQRAVVQGLNMRKKHIRKSQESPQGVIIDIENPIHLSNLMVLVDENKPKKLYAQLNNKGEKELYYKDGQNKVTYRPLKKS